jgi:hypothetical protein
MTIREAFFQAQMELGKSREEVELKAQASDGFLPGTGALTQSPVKAGHERALIESLKQLFRQMDANPEGWQTFLRTEIGKRAKKN